MPRFFQKIKNPCLSNLNLLLGNDRLITRENVREQCMTEPSISVQNIDEENYEKKTQLSLGRLYDECCSLKGDLIKTT